MGFCAGKGPGRPELLSDSLTTPALIQLCGFSSLIEPPYVLLGSGPAHLFPRLFQLSSTPQTLTLGQSPQKKNEACGVCIWCFSFHTSQRQCFSAVLCPHPSGHFFGLVSPFSIKHSAGFACHLLQEAFPDFPPYNIPSGSELLGQVGMDNLSLSMLF